MKIGPLEYVVIGLQDYHNTNAILPELSTIQENGLIQVRDLVFVSTSLDGTITIKEINELSEEEQKPYGNLQDNLTGLLTTQDVEHLARTIPFGMLAIVVLLEHTWTLSLTEAVRSDSGVLFTGGLVTPEVLTQVSAELAKKEEHYA